jgi:AcrR family transcriptional regulator
LLRFWQRGREVREATQFGHCGGHSPSFGPRQKATNSAGRPSGVDLCLVSVINDRLVGHYWDHMARIVDRDAKSLQIIEAAAGVFARKGFEAALMDDMAAAAGMSKGCLYDYFENKEDLFFAVFQWSQRKILSIGVEQPKTSAPIKERISNFVEAAVSTLVDQVDIYPLTLEVWSAAATRDTRRRFLDAMRALYAQYRGQLEALLRSAQKNGEIKKGTDTRTIAATIIGAVDGLMLQYWLEPTFDPKVRVHMFLCALFDGIAATKSGR